MQDKDIFNGVNGKYTDHNEENGIGKKDDDKEIASIPRPRKPHITPLVAFYSLLFQKLHFDANRLISFISCGIL